MKYTWIHVVFNYLLIIEFKFMIEFEINYSEAFYNANRNQSHAVCIKKKSMVYVQSFHINVWFGEVFENFLKFKAIYIRQTSFPIPFATPATMLANPFRGDRIEMNVPSDVNDTLCLMDLGKRNVLNKRQYSIISFDRYQRLDPPLHQFPSSIDNEFNFQRIEIAQTKWLVDGARIL